MIRSYLVDAFTSLPFSGNPAAVVILPKGTSYSDKTAQLLATEFNLSETAFCSPLETENEFNLRWFTPLKEVPLCGHATLASACAIFHANLNTSNTLNFHTKSGILSVSQVNEEGGTLLEMNFPLNKSQPYPINEAIIETMTCFDLLSMDDVESVHFSPTTRKLFIVLKSTPQNLSNLLNMKADTKKLVQVNQPDWLGLSVTMSTRDFPSVVTPKNEQIDFCSRYFAPWVGIDEDPVTGSLHTVLTPYWRERFVSSDDKGLIAKQVSPRGGVLYLNVSQNADRVIIRGYATVVSKGELCVNL
jgi:PhzF family phenazine biosynthesis protein